MGLLERVKHFQETERGAVILATVDELSWELSDLGVVDLKELLNDPIEAEIFNSLPPKSCGDACLSIAHQRAVDLLLCISEHALPGTGIIVNVPAYARSTIEQTFDQYGFVPIFVDQPEFY